MTHEPGDVMVEPIRQPMRERLRTPNGRVALRISIVFLVMSALLLAFGLWWPGATLPVTASDTEGAVKLSIIVFSVAAAPVMALVWAIAYFSIRHWGHSGDAPPDDGPPIRTSTRVTVAWLLVSSVLVTFLLTWGLSEQTATTSVAAGSTPLIVNVTGQQWVWTFSYPGDSGISSTELALPLNRPVVFHVRSKDVIHSFWLPEMGVKVDANPEVTTETSTTPTLLGTFNVRCAELCGLNHSYMQTTATVLSANDFDSWVKSQGGIPGQQAPTEASNG